MPFSPPAELQKCWRLHGQVNLVSSHLLCSECCNISPQQHRLPQIFQTYPPISTLASHRISSQVQSLSPYLQRAPWPGIRILKDSLKLQEDDHGWQLCSSGTMEVLTIRVMVISAGDRSFFGGGLRLWNKLPADLRTIKNFTTFCSKCKAHFFDLAFSNKHIATSIYK